MRFLKSWISWLIVAIIALITWFLLWAPSWFWHPLGYCPYKDEALVQCKGYNGWSGSFSDISEITLLVSMISALIMVRQFLHAHFECHNDDCHRLGFHHVPGTSYRTCWHCHPILSEHDKHGVPLGVIHERHDAAKEAE